MMLFSLFLFQIAYLQAYLRVTYKLIFTSLFTSIFSLFLFQIAYVAFLATYTYICLVKTPYYPSVPELYVTACMICYGCEKIRTIIATEPSGLIAKLRYSAFLC
jgi:hypothetical protein